MSLTTLYLYELDLTTSRRDAPVPAAVEVALWRALLRQDIGWPPAVVQRFSRGERCAVAIAGGRVVAHCWMATTPVWVEELRRVLHPAAGEVYLYDAYTDPAWRDQGLFRTLLRRLLVEATTCGYTRALIFVGKSNRASIRAVEWSEFQRFEAVWRLAFLGRDLLLFCPRRGRTGSVDFRTPGVAAGPG